MRAELEMLSSMGSNWASATLGYLCLLPCGGAATDAQRAIDLCSRPARERDPYALFVLGWAIYLLTRDRSRAAVPMFESSKMDFVPATLAMVFFVWPRRKQCYASWTRREGVGTKPRGPLVARSIVPDALDS